MSLFPQSIPGELIVTLAPPVCVGGETPAAHLCLEPGRAGRQAGTERQTRSSVSLSCGWPASLISGVWGTQTLGYLFSSSCAIREAAAPDRPAPPPLGYTRVAQTIFQIKNSSYHAGGLLYSSSSEPGPTLLHPKGLSHTSHTTPSAHGGSSLDSGAVGGNQKPRTSWFARHLPKGSGEGLNAGQESPPRSPLGW